MDWIPVLAAVSIALLGGFLLGWNPLANRRRILVFIAVPTVATALAVLLTDAGSIRSRGDWTSLLLVAGAVAVGAFAIAAMAFLMDYYSRWFEERKAIKA